MEDFEYENSEHLITAKEPWKKIIKTVLKNKKLVVGLIFSVVFSVILDIGYPLLNSYAIETYFKGTDPNRFNSVGWFVAMYMIAAVLFGVSIWAFLFFASKLEVVVSYELRKEAYLNLQKLSFSYFDQTAQGWIMARLTSDARKLSEILSWGMVDFVWALLSMFGILGILLAYNAKLALVVICVLPIVLIIVILIRMKILKAYREARAYNSKITAAYNEGFMGAKATKSLVIEEKNSKEFHKKAYDYKKASLRAVLFSSLFGPFVFIMCYFTVGATLYVGTVLTVSIPVLYLFVDYAIRFFEPVMSISHVIGDFQQAQASAERIISLIDQESEINDTLEVIEKYGTIMNPKYENFEPLIGDVEFKDVTFKYNKGETVLKNFNLHIPAGSNVALVGHTGSGKSTIVNLICRFYEPTTGQILIDGKDYKERSITWLHSNLGYVLQTPQLFTGSILDNVRYGKLDATDEECINALKLVAADEFIQKLPDGYNSSVGESGNKLSLGEKQLISFARAIIANPSILVLDEATSSIDTKTESMIQNAIEVVLKGRTSFMIAHRLSTVVNCDLILVMRDGVVVESGKHHELLEKKGYYFELYKNQMSDAAINKLLDN
ncbi:MAG: ABC transporter ATP-binding protein [Acholeplasmatales bacterium]|nr:ABC transporter ATP-binding protein [Acholeplasmatales bacterium]